MRFRRRPLKKSEAKFGVPLRGCRFPSTSSPRPSDGPCGRRKIASIESPPAKSTFSAVSSISGTALGGGSLVLFVRCGSRGSPALQAFVSLRRSRRRWLNSTANGCRCKFIKRSIDPMLDARRAKPAPTRRLLFPAASVNSSVTVSAMSSRSLSDHGCGASDLVIAKDYGVAPRRKAQTIAADDPSTIGKISDLAEDDIHVNASADNLCRDLARDRSRTCASSLRASLDQRW